MLPVVGQAEPGDGHQRGGLQLRTTQGQHQASQGQDRAADQQAAVSAAGELLQMRRVLADLPPTPPVSDVRIRTYSGPEDDAESDEDAPAPGPADGPGSDGPSDAAGETVGVGAAPPRVMTTAPPTAR